MAHSDPPPPSFPLPLTQYQYLVARQHTGLNERIWLVMMLLVLTTQEASVKVESHTRRDIFFFLWVVLLTGEDNVEEWMEPLPDGCVIPKKRR